MSERMTQEFRTLFEVRILHHYWLDDGANVFDRVADQIIMSKRLQSYDMRRFLAVQPTITTRETLKANQCLCEETAMGIIVLSRSTAELPDDTVFEFLLTVKDGRLFEYTASTLRPQRIYESYYEPDDLNYRYKENVPVLSNLTGATRGTAPDQSLFLSREYRSLTADDQVEALGLSGNALVQLTSDGPNATTQALALDANDLPVYLHPGDLPAIIPPAGLVGAPSRGVRLSDDVADNVFVLMRLTAVHPDDSAFSFVDAAGRAKSNPPVYQLRLKNRSTFWTYVNKTTGAVDSIESNALPLTYFGNAGQKQKPSEGLVKVEKTGTIITRLISEVHV